MQTRAGLFRAVGDPLEVVELDLAEPGPHDVVVRMAAVGICGTDLHQVKGEFRRPTPIVLGHEGAHERTTSSPTNSESTSSPTCSTIPAPSWPSTIGVGRCHSPLT